jgi:uncharacterized membrane-anchored protein YjiN (DUF445 family)
MKQKKQPRKRTQKKQPVRMQMGGVQHVFLNDIAGMFYQLYKEHHNHEKGTQKILEYVRDIEKLYSKDDEETIQTQINEFTEKMTKDIHIGKVNPPSEKQKEKGEKLIQTIIEELHTYKNEHQGKEIPDDIIREKLQPLYKQLQTPGIHRNTMKKRIT